MWIYWSKSCSRNVAEIESSFLQRGYEIWIQDDKKIFRVQTSLWKILGDYFPIVSSGWLDVDNQLGNVNNLKSMPPTF